MPDIGTTDVIVLNLGEWIWEQVQYYVNLYLVIMSKYPYLMNVIVKGKK